VTRTDTCVQKRNDGGNLQQFLMNIVSFLRSLASETDSCWHWSWTRRKNANYSFLTLVRNSRFKFRGVTDICSDTGLFNYQDIEFDYSNFFENDVSKYEKLNERTLQEWRKHEPQQYETARAAVLQQISEKNFPYRDATLAVTGSTLAIFGGNHESIWSCSDILTLDLSPLLPYLSLEQLAGIAASKNCANYSIGEMKRVVTAIRSKFNLY
jgi:hypothetical protein